MRDPVGDFCIIVLCVLVSRVSANPSVAYKAMLNSHQALTTVQTILLNSKFSLLLLYAGQ
jgi:hypothetical protein